MSATTDKLDLFTRRLAPGAITLVAVIVSAIPWYLPNIGPVSPMITLMMVYYWALRRPGLLPPIALFGIGCFHDLLIDWPLGLGPFVFLLTYAAVGWRAKFLAVQPFLALWLFFAIVAACTAAVGWLVASALAFSPMDPLPLIFQVLISIGFYPAAALLCAWLDRGFLPVPVKT